MRLADLQDDWFEEGREQGLEEGRAEGRAEGLLDGVRQGKIQMLLELVRKERLSLDEAIADSGLAREEFMAAFEQYKLSELAEK